MKSKKYDDFAITSFVLSLAFLSGFFYINEDPLFWFSVCVVFILSVVTGVIGLKRTYKNKSLKGAVIAIIGLVISLASLLLFLFFLAFVLSFRY